MPIFYCHENMEINVSPPAALTDVLICPSLV